MNNNQIPTYWNDQYPLSNPENVNPGLITVAQPKGHNPFLSMTHFVAKLAQDQHDLPSLIPIDLSMFEDMFLYEKEHSIVAFAENGELKEQMIPVDDQIRPHDPLHTTKLNNNKEKTSAAIGVVENILCIVTLKDIS